MLAGLAGFFKLMLNVVHLISSEGKDLCFGDFMDKIMLMIGLRLDVY